MKRIRCLQTCLEHGDWRDEGGRNYASNGPDCEVVRVYRAAATSIFGSHTLKLAECHEIRTAAQTHTRKRRRHAPPQSEDAVAAVYGGQRAQHTVFREGAGDRGEWRGCGGCVVLLQASFKDI